MRGIRRECAVTGFATSSFAKPRQARKLAISRLGETWETFTHTYTHTHTFTRTQLYTLICGGGGGVREGRLFYICPHKCTEVLKCPAQVYVVTYTCALNQTFIRLVQHEMESQLQACRGTRGAEAFTDLFANYFALARHSRESGSSTSTGVDRPIFARVASIGYSYVCAYLYMCVCKYSCCFSRSFFSRLIHQLISAPLIFRNVVLCPATY